MRVVFSVAPAKTNVTKKARSLIARAPNKWVFFLLFRFETACDVWEFEKETKRTPIPCYTLSIQKNTTKLYSIRIFSTPMYSPKKIWSKNKTDT